MYIKGMDGTAAETNWQERTGSKRTAALTATDAQNIAEFESASAAYKESYLGQLHRAVQEGAVIKASQSSEPLYRYAQEQLDLMRQKHPAWRDKNVDVYIHRDQARSPTNPDFEPLKDAAATYPEMVQIGESLLAHIMGNDPTKLKALIAHEFGHSVNGDNLAAKTYAWLNAPRNHQNEILANRMAAILFGNPKAFGEAYCSIGERGETATHPSTQQMRMQIARWAELLDQQGVLDANGNVTDTEKALSIFEASKFTAMTEYSQRNQTGTPILGKK